VSNLGTLITQIGSEINRTDLDTLIGTAIQTAIRKHQTNKVNFNQFIDTTQVTTASSEDLPIPTNCFAIDSIRMNYGTNDYRVLDIRGWTDMQRNYDNVNPGRPTIAALFNGVIKLRPKADAVYSTVISGYQTYAIPSGSTDTHPWMTNAENLIKWEAKAFLYADVLEDENRAVWFSNMAGSELRRILGTYMAETQSNALGYN